MHFRDTWRHFAGSSNHWAAPYSSPATLASPSSIVPCSTSPGSAASATSLSHSADASASRSVLSHARSSRPSSTRLGRPVSTARTFCASCSGLAWCRKFRLWRRRCWRIACGWRLHSGAPNSARPDASWGWGGALRGPCSTRVWGGAWGCAKISQRRGKTPQIFLACRGPTYIVF